jgi:3-isopropylmalate/(R)-2-methylmalate dehydratase small subunit
MQKFTVHQGLVAPMDRENVDTDAIIPKQFLKSIKKTGFGPNLFDEWRYLDKPGEPGVPESSAQAQPRLRAEPAALPGRQHPAGAQELWLRLQPRARALGAGAVRLSRHHRAQLCRHLLQQLLQERPAAHRAARGHVSAQLFDEVAAFPGYQLTIDLERQVIVRPQGEEIPFDVQPFRKYCLLNGFDDIGLTLRHKDKIAAFEAQRLATKPWLAHTMVGVIQGKKTNFGL